MAKKNRPDSSASADTPSGSELSTATSLPADKREAGSAGTLSRFEKYEIIEVHRSELVNAPYNPRRMSDKARSKLRKNLQTVGLIEPLIWNKATGHIVGGHQRIRELDALEGTKDYRLRVAAVEMDLATEKAQNIFLNNEAAQGEYDFEELEKLLVQEKVDYEAAGFSSAEVFQMFGDQALADRPKELIEMVEECREKRAQFEANMADNDDVRLSDQDDFYAVVVFGSDEERDEFIATIGGTTDRYVDGRDLWDFMLATHVTVDPADLDRETITDAERAAIVAISRAMRAKQEAPAEAQVIIEANNSLSNFFERRIIEQYECARCEKTHKLTVLPLKQATIRETHWGYCRFTGEPVTAFFDRNSLPPYAHQLLADAEPAPDAEPVPDDLSPEPAGSPVDLEHAAAD